MSSPGTPAAALLRSARKEVACAREASGANAAATMDLHNPPVDNSTCNRRSNYLLDPGLLRVQHLLLRSHEIVLLRLALHLLQLPTHPADHPHRNAPTSKQTSAPTQTHAHKLYSECQLRSIACSPPSRSPMNPTHPACPPQEGANSAGSPRRPPTCRTAQPQSLRQRVDCHTASKPTSQNNAHTRWPELGPSGALDQYGQEQDSTTESGHCKSRRMDQ